MEVQCLSIKVKKGKTQLAREWCERLVKHPDLDYVLEEETVMVESLFLDERENDTYLIFYLRAKNLTMANEFLLSENHPLNTLSLQFMEECWDIDSIRSLETILDVDRI